MSAHWVVIQRRTWEGELMSDLLIGPYDSDKAAMVAMEDSALVNGICEDTKREFSVEDDVYVTDDPNPEGERMIVDLTDPDHTGTAEANAAESDGVILCVLCKVFGLGHDGEHIVP